jgi:cold shock CspA family protein
LNVLLLLLVLLGGVLSWAVIGGGDEGTVAGTRCIWAVTTNDGYGYREAPCGQQAKDLFDHPLGDLYCDSALRVQAPNNNLGHCPKSRKTADRAAHGPVKGTVVRWNDDEGWGVLASPAVSGKVWAHFSNIVGTGYKTLHPGQSVTFIYETPGQDGFPHRAIAVQAQ